jgi:hypothetical protein
VVAAAPAGDADPAIMTTAASNMISNPGAGAVKGFISAFSLSWSGRVWISAP